MRLTLGVAVRAAVQELQPELRIAERLAQHHLELLLEGWCSDCSTSRCIARAANSSAAISANRKPYQTAARAATNTQMTMPYSPCPRRRRS